MANPNDLELALRIRADLDEATRKLAKLDGELKKLAGSDGKAAKGLDGTARAADRQTRAVDQAERATRRKTSANRDLEQSEDRAGRAADRTTRTLQKQARQLARGDFAGTGVDLLTSGRLSAAATTAGIAISGLGLAILGSVRLLSEAQSEQAAYDSALIRTGGHVGRTREELAAFAAELDQLGGVTTGSAARAIAQIAASGEFAGEQFELATRAAVAWSAATGDSIDKTIAEFQKLKGDPVEALLALNDQYHFLTQEQLDRVDALIEEGREQEAVTEAFRIYSRVIEDRAPKMREALSPFQQIWRDIREAAREAWDEMIGLFRGDQINALRDRMADIAGLAASLSPFGSLLGGVQGGRGVSRGLLGGLFSAPADFSGVTGSVVDSEAERERRAADKQWQRETERFLSDRLKMEKEIAAARELGLKAGKSEAEIEKQVAAIRADFAARASRRRRGRKPGATDAQRADQAAQRELQNLQRQTALLGELEEGEHKAGAAARIRFEIEQGAYRLASPALQQQLRDQAQLLDAEQMRVDLAKQMVDVQLRIHELRGRGDEGSLQKTLTELERLRRKAIEVKDAAATANIAKLMQLERANAELQGVQRNLDTFTQRITAAEQRINIQRENGLITGIEAQRRLLALRQEEIAQLQALIPQLEAAAAVYGDMVPPELTARIDELKNQLLDLQTQGTLLQTTFRNTFESGLSDVLFGLATSTATLKEAALGLINDMIAGMARLAAQQLANIATTKLMAALFKQQQPADVGQGAAKLTTAAAATGAAGLAIGAGATQLTAAAAALQGAATTLMIANSIGGGFAEGGFTGHGGKYQLAGYVHKGEGVLNQGEIRALGGPSGFYALRDAIADGSLSLRNAAPVRTAAAPRFSFAEGGFAGAGMPAPVVKVGVNNIIAPRDIGDAYFDDPDNDATIHNWMARSGYRRHGT